MNQLRSSAVGSIAGVVLGFVLVAIAWHSGGSTAFATDTNVYVSPGLPQPNCSDWQFDTDPFPGTGVTYNYYWSGQSRYWNLPAAHHCWHNDEHLHTNWKAVDYPGSEDQVVQYRATVFTSNATPYQMFTYDPTNCGGIDVAMWNISGVMVGNMHYWHAYALANVYGSTWANHFYVPGQSLHYRDIAGILHRGNDGCVSTGEHVHQAIDESSPNAVPYKTGNLNQFPFYFR